MSTYYGGYDDLENTPSPTLLVALEGMVEAFKDTERFADQHTAMRNARAAIRAAKGESNDKTV